MSTSQAPSGTVPVASAGVDTSSPKLTLPGMYPVRKGFFLIGLIVLVGLWTGWAAVALVAAAWAALSYASGRGQAIVKLQFFDTGLMVVKGQGFLSEEYEAYEVPWTVVEEVRLKPHMLIVKHHDERLRASLGDRFSFFPAESKWATELQDLHKTGAIPQSVKFFGLKFSAFGASSQPPTEPARQEAQAAQVAPLA